MKISACLLVVVFKLLTVKGDSWESNFEPVDFNKQIEAVRLSVRRLTQQVMMQQMLIEERVRTEGGSGVKVVRSIGWNLKNYDSATYINGKVFSIHDHSDYDRTLGLGEMDVVLNGIDFRTRHNDYKLVMPSRTSKTYHALENIPFPDVPPEVLTKPTIQEQIAEMKKWLQAFKRQDSRERNYAKYFKPVMCYLEGAWTVSQKLEEPFPSDRHQLDATTWQELHQKNYFMSQTGVRSRLENLAFLPTAIVFINETSGEPIYAQWNYRIVCSPVDFNIPLSAFKQENDLAFRVSTGMNINQVRETRAARFKLFDGKRNQKYTILDKVFATIPGKDNYGTNLSMDAFGDVMYDTADDNNVLLNTGNYHRSYKLFKKGASGVSFAPLGFNDENMWMAQTTQENVAPIAAQQCYLVEGRRARSRVRCSGSNVRVSHAIPLEIIYLTPLLSWNPYKIMFNEDRKTTTESGRDGNSEAKAYNGVDGSHYYMTPVELFTAGKLKDTDPADTVKLHMYVLGADGTAKKVAASGTRISLPNIEGIGQIRLRYPIAPVHGEGSPVWKELNALKDRVLDIDKGPPTSVLFQMGETTRNPPGEHTHDVSMSYDEFRMLKSGKTVNVTSDTAQGHAHNLVLTYKDSKYYIYASCDGASRCWDGHPITLKLMTNNAYTQGTSRKRKLPKSRKGRSENNDYDYCDNGQDYGRCLAES